MIDSLVYEEDYEGTRIMVYYQPYDNLWYGGCTHNNVTVGFSDPIKEVVFIKIKTWISQCNAEYEEQYG